MTTRAHDVVQAFDVPMQSIALGLAGVLIEQRAIRAADRQEARAIRQATAALAYRRVMAEHRAKQEAKAIVAARADRYARQRQAAIIAARRAALGG
ncbi:hypothetical protein [Methylobacterium nonmethylotrophicum]|uniref:Uncharacterized protein n=1 Tax=Methylobacterium nonmethylotrophicum TaxID=1141884 RepID=A0A4Z0NHI7_9HYPH|nr:hypothetical protein [Methylobacterium nonmethylotrophicum]TGD95236.1 hypothetical protein EU555_28645 [Methylobacterium nonmethylotrophicum]